MTGAEDGVTAAVCIGTRGLISRDPMKSVLVSPFDLIPIILLSFIGTVFFLNFSTNCTIIECVQEGVFPFWLATSNRFSVDAPRFTVSLKSAKIVRRLERSNIYFS